MACAVDGMYLDMDLDLLGCGRSLIALVPVFVEAQEIMA